MKTYFNFNVKNRTFRANLRLYIKAMIEGYIF